jgi:hypothetical protein
MSTATSEISVIQGAIIEYERDSLGMVSLVKVHQPLVTSASDIEAINDAMYEFLGNGFRLEMQPFEMIGMVGIKKWKVIYE